MNYNFAADSYSEFLHAYIARHFDVVPEPTKGCARVVDIHRQLFSYSRKPCPDGCGMYVPFIPTTRHSLEVDWVRYHDQFRSSKIRGTGVAKYTNLIRKDCTL